MSKYVVPFLLVCAVVSALMLLITQAVGQKAAIYRLSAAEAHEGRSLFVNQQRAEDEFSSWKRGIESQFACGASLEFNSTFTMAHPENGGTSLCVEQTETALDDSIPVKGKPCEASSPAVGSILGWTGRHKVVWDCVSGVWTLTEMTAE